MISRIVTTSILASLLSLAACQGNNGLNDTKAQNALNKVKIGEQGETPSVKAIRAEANGEVEVEVTVKNYKVSDTTSLPNHILNGPAIARFQKYADGKFKLVQLTIEYPRECCGMTGYDYLKLDIPAE